MRTLPPTRPRRPVAPALALLLAACEPDRVTEPGGGTRYRVASVGAAFGFPGHETESWLPAGDTATLRALAFSGGWPSHLVFDSHASDSVARRFAWTSSDPTVATVGPTGLVTALRPGVTQLDASVDGVRSDGPLLTVYPAAARLVVDPGEIATELGALSTVRVTARDAEGREVAGVPVAFYSRSLPVAGPTHRLQPALTPVERTLYAWRGGTTVIELTRPHPRP